MPNNDIELVSENYRWHQSTNEIEDWRTGNRSLDSEFKSKINVYEDRVRTWFLDLAIKETSVEPSPGDYVAVSIAIAYVEGVEQYRNGEGGSPGASFKNSARRVFPQAPNDAIDRLWTDVRCGLFHSGFTEKPTALAHRYAHAIAIDDGKLMINPARFVKAVLDDFNRYIQELRDNPDGELAKQFVSLWDKRWQET